MSHASLLYTMRCLVNSEGDIPSRYARLVVEDALIEIDLLRNALALIADIAEGSTTVNSLPNIARCARNNLGRLSEEDNDLER